MKLESVRPSDTDSRVYQFGVRVAPESRQKLREQFSLAHATYNAIVAEIRSIDNEAREWLQEKAGDAAVSLRQEIALVEAQMGDAKAADDRVRFKELATERRALWTQWYQLLHESRRVHTAELKREYMDKIGERSACPIYQIRCEAVAQGLGWATANAALKAAINAHKKQWPKFKVPNFRKIAEVPNKVIELQFTAKGGISVDELLSGKHPEISINGGAVGRRTYVDFRMRVGAGEAREDIVGTVYLHRPIPPEGRIKYARLVERRIGKDFRHYLQLVLTDLRNDDALFSKNAKPAVAALDFGWYYEDDGRRIAGFAESSDPDKAIVLRLPLEVDELLRKSNEKKSTRDQLRDEIVGELKALELKALNNGPDSIRDELITMRRLPLQHVAQTRLVRLVYKWRNEAPDFIPQFLERLEAWRKEDKLLLQAESHLGFRARNLRKKFYEKLALDLVQRYDTIVIDTPELAETAKVKNKTTGEHNKLGGVARSGRVLAALYEFEQALVKAAAKYGVAVAKIKGRTSKTCSLCQGYTAPVNPADREVICRECGAVIDREANAAALIWQEAQARYDDIKQKCADRRDELANQIIERKVRKEIRQQARSESARTRRSIKNAGRIADQDSSASTEN